MTTPEDANQAIRTKIEALKAAFNVNLTVKYDNRFIDYSAQTEPFLEVEILNINGYRATIGPNGTHRILGSIILTARVREGDGIAAANAMLQAFYPGIHMSDTAVSPVRTEATKLTRAKKEGDWAGEAAVIPFWYDN